MKLSKVFFALTCSIAMVAFAAKQVQASLLVDVGDTIRLLDGPGTGNGGEFRVQKKIGSTWSGTLFNTFCVELHENIALGTAYKIGTISTVTKLSNKNLTVGVAMLYKAFFDGYMANASSISIGTGVNTATFDFANNPNRENDARSLQLAIWKSIGWDITGQSGYTSGAVKTKADKWIAYAATFAPPESSADFQGVRIMNLVGTNNLGNFQDQLVMVPEPDSFLIWSLVGVGLVSVIGSSRRRG